MKRITLHNVRRWVERKPEGAVVGRVGISTACLLANYVRERGKMDEAYVGPTGSVRAWRGFGIHAQGNQMRVYIPGSSKAACVVRAFDRLGFVGDTIRREQALAMLEGLA